jgi:hypothetical protein
MLPGAAVHPGVLPYQQQRQKHSLSMQGRSKVASKGGFRVSKFEASAVRTVDEVCFVVAALQQN